MRTRQRRPLLGNALSALVLAAALTVVTCATTGSGGVAASGGKAAAGPQPAGQQPAVAKAKKKKDPVAIFAEPWPDAAKLRERKLQAESLPLFASEEPLTLTLAADFKTINRDRDPKSEKQYDAQFTVPADGSPRSIKTTVGGRGVLRRKPQVCAFIPLRLAFTKADVKGTPFEGLDHVKLVTHCQKDYEKHVLSEYLAYRLFNLLTPQSYRARLARMTYVDSLTGKTVDTRWAMFIEDQDDVARRMEGRAVELMNKLLSQMVPDALLRQTVLQYMIGNTDISIYLLHNMRLVQRPDELRLYPISYDFDLSGLVNPPYGAPDPKLPIRTLRERYYRGPCVPAEEMEPILAEFRAKKAEALALVDAIPALDRDDRQDLRDYLEDFYGTINNKGATKRAFVDGCKNRPIM